MGISFLFFFLCLPVFAQYSDDEHYQVAVRAFDSNFHTYEEELGSLIEQPSISTSQELHHRLGIEEKARRIHALANSHGATSAEIWRHPKGSSVPPVVFAEWKTRNRIGYIPRVLLYSHYDIQPPSEGIHELKLRIEKDRWVARGVVDNTYAVISQFAAIDSLRKAIGDVPVDLSLIVEGEAEVGSVHFSDFIRQRRGSHFSDYIIVQDGQNGTKHLHSGMPVVWSLEVGGLNAKSCERMLGALSIGYKRSAVCLDCGGSIKAASLLAAAFPRTPMLIIGTINQESNIHAPKESLAIEDFKGTTRSLISFLMSVPK